MVEQNCSIPFDFRCISDHEIPGVKVIPFSRDIHTSDKHHSLIPDTEVMVLNDGKPQGCWAKVDAWLAPLGSYNLLLDLDICITGDLAQLVSSEPAAARDCRHTETKPWMNGSCIAWKSTKHTQAVYPKEIPYTEYPRGEQEYVQKALGGFIPMLDVLSYKCHLTGTQRHAVPERVIIVYFHGYPTPADGELQQYGFVGPTWKGIERIDRV